MSRTVTSNNITFMDLTDSRKLDAYITSNLPTTQIYNQNANTSTYTPDWSSTNLQLSADIYLDSKVVTDNSDTSIVWYKKVGTQAKTQVGTGKSLTVNSNQLSSSVGIITYICEAKYNDTETNPPTAHAEIVFTRVDAGLNGSNGTNAPAVVAQYSDDGTTGWTSTLNAATHKYIRHSYDGGKTWSTAIKMVGEDGTSVTIKGTVTSVTKVTGTDYYTLLDNSTSITSAELGDSYLYKGNLYVCVDSRDGQDYFINAGNIQGPSGNDGKSSYVFIRYATDTNGTNMSTSPTGKTYIGIYTSDTNVAPTTAGSYIWSKFVGDSAKSIILNGNCQVFKVSKEGTITPSTITVTAQTLNTSVTSWTYSTNGGQTFRSTVPTGVSLNGDTVSIDGSSITSNSIVIKASDGTYSDTYTIHKVSDGSDGAQGEAGISAPIAFLTNENITFSANAQGQITGTSIISNVVAYNGTTKVLPTIGTITGAPTGMTITSSTISASNEIMLTITIDNNATLGSTSSNTGIISIPIISPVSTILYLTWSKINTGATGAQGATGNAGADAYTVLLTNESHVFPGDVSNAIASTATTQALAYKGSTAQTITIVSVNGVAASTSSTATGITGLSFACSALSGTNPTITFTSTTDFKTVNGTIPIVLTVGGLTFTKQFSYSISFKGNTGASGAQGAAGNPATAYWLISNASVVHKTSTGTIACTPSTLTFTAKSQTGVATPTDYAGRWIISYSTDGSTYTELYKSTTNEASKTITVGTTYKTIKCQMYLAGGTTTLLDEQIIPIVSDGTPGTSASLVTVTPSALYFKSTTGKNGNFSPDYIYLYPRFQNATYSNWQYSTDGVNWVAVSGANGLTVGTYNSVANSLMISKTSTLYTDTITSISFRCNSTVSTVYDIVSIAKIYDVVDLQIGARNLAEKTNQGVTNWTWAMQAGDYTKEEYVDSNKVKCCKLTKGTDTAQSGWSVIEYTNIGVFKYEPDQTYTISFDVLSSVTTSMSVRLLQGNGTNDLGSKYVAIKNKVTENVWSKIVYTVNTLSTLPELSSQCLYITGMSSANGVSYVFKNVQITKGNTLSDWSPAPEDLVEESSSVNAILSNEAHFFVANSNGVPTASSVVLDVIGFKGSTRFATTVGTITGLPSAGMTTTISNNGTTSTKITVAVTTALTSAIADYGTLTIPITVNGKTINKVFSWSKSKAGTDAITFQIYAPNGYILTADLPSLTLQTFAYEGSATISSGATFQWYSWDNDAWVSISGSTSNSLTVTKTDVLKSNSYKCEMTYKSKIYTATATVEDKTDIYESLIRVNAKYSVNNTLYWILYATIYSEDGERDALLGPISDTAPIGVAVGSYWYKVDNTVCTITLMKYTGTEWISTTDTQELQYDWFLFKDVEDMVTLGESSKVKIVVANDFSHTCNIQCNISDSNYLLLSRNNQSLTDPSDPIVSNEAPSNPTNGQMWIKTNTDGSYVLSIWNSSQNQWAISNTDNQNKVYTTKPTSYKAGDVWLVGGDYQPTIYKSGVAQTDKYLVGTMLKAQYASTTYKDSDWVEALSYKEQLNDLQEHIDTYNQYFSFDNSGVIMTAKDASGNVSDFKTKLTNTELGFYQGDDKVAHINDNTLIISKAQINTELSVVGDAPTLKVGNFIFIQESNGSFSISTDIS